MNQLMQYKELLETLNLTKRISSGGRWKDLLNMTHWLRGWIPNPVVPCSKPLGGSKVNSAFHPSEVDKMSTSNFLELSGKK